MTPEPPFEPDPARDRWQTITIWLVLMFFAAQLPAQAVKSPTDPLSNSAVPAPHLSQDRTNQQQFVAVQKAIAKNDLVSAGELIRRLLELPEDRWFDDGAVSRGVRRELRRQLTQWPDRLQELYGQDLATRAAPELEAASSAQDVPGLLAVATRYPDTDASRLALRRAAVFSWDRGDFAAAAAISARSLPNPDQARAEDLPVILHNAAARWRAGERDRARVGLLQYSQLFDAAPLLAARRIDAALASFDNQSTESRPAEPLFPAVTPRWSESVLSDRSLNDLFDAASQNHRHAGLPLLPAAFPCLTDSRVILRTESRLVAFDLASGQLAWEANALGGGSNPRSQSLDNPGFRDFKSQELLRYLVQNQVTGSCVADRERVYVISDRPCTPADDQQTPRPTNQVFACRLTDGSVAWQSGYNPELTNVFFLSQPLLRGDRLYLIGESESQLRLIVLNGANGQIDWQIPLAIVKHDLQLHPARRLRQLPLLWHDGWLICPTGSGCVVSIDTVSRNYEWAYRYANRDAVPRQPGRFASDEQVRFVPHAGWQRIGLASDLQRVYLASPETESIQALDIQSGQLVWEHPRKDGLYLGGLVGGKLIVVGYRSLRGLDPLTGQIVWQRDIERPNGIGLARGTDYLLPLESGSVLLVDAATGKTVRGAHGQQTPLGNLVAGANVLVSLTPQRLEIYEDWDFEHAKLLAKLKDKPDDPALLNQLYNQMRRGGEVTQVADLLRGMYRQKPNPTLRVQLVRTLVDLIATHPARRADTVTELTPLLAELGDQADELRCRIQAHSLLGQRPDALRAAIKLASLASIEEFESGPDRQTLVRGDRAVQGIILQLLDENPDPQTPQLNEIFDLALKSARDSSDPFALQRFGLQFSHLPWGRQARLDDHLKVGIGWPAFRTELNLLDLTEEPDTSLAASALWTLGQEMTQRSFRQDAVRYYSTLRDRYPDVRLTASQTAAQAVDSLPPSLVKTRLDAAPVEPWPPGPPKISKPKGKLREPFLMPLPVEASPGSLLDRVNVHVDLNAGKLVCQGDGFSGYWEIPLPKSRSPLREYIKTYHGWGLGQLLVARLGTQLYGISLLDNTGEPNGRVVWSFDLADDLSGRFEVGEVQNRQGLGEAEVVIFDEYGREVGLICVMQPGYFCYRHRSEIIVADTATGRILWRRRNQPLGVHIAGDARSLYLLHAQEQEKSLEVVRIADGSTERRIPWLFPIEAKPLFHRGLAIVSDMDENALRVRWIRLHDLHILAEHRLSKVSHRLLFDPHTLGLLQQDRTLRWFDLATGKQQGRVSLDVPPDVSRVHAWQDGQRFYILPSGIPPYRGAGRVPQIRDGFRQHRVHGTLHAIDRTSGQITWKRSLEDTVFPLDQPRGAPIFVLNYRTLANGISEPSKPPAPGEIEGVLHILDRRTGQDIHREQSAKLSPAITVEVNQELQSLDIHGEGERLRLEFGS